VIFIYQMYLFKLFSFANNYVKLCNVLRSEGTKVIQMNTFSLCYGGKGLFNYVCVHEEGVLILLLL